MTKLYYFGDINPENGGYFYTLHAVEHGYVPVVRIVPCKHAGLAENEYWIEYLTVNFPVSELKAAHVLETVGMTVAELTALQGADRYYRTLLDACLASGSYDTSAAPEAVRIGKRDAFAPATLPDTEITVCLKHNAKIGNYARRKASHYCR